MSLSERTQILLTTLHSTGESDLGPHITFGEGRVSVRYDYEDEDGLGYCTIDFFGAIGIRVTPDYLAEDFLFDAYSKVCERLDSRWLNTMDRNKEHGSSIASLRHFFVFFDHHCAVEVLAKSFALS